MFTNLPCVPVPYTQPKITPPEMRRFLQARGWLASADDRYNELWQHYKYSGMYFEPAEAVVMEIMQMEFVQVFQSESSS